MLYRDVTYDTETQAILRGLENWLDTPGRGGAYYLSALRRVLDGWDANDATETTFAESQA